MSLTLLHPQDLDRENIRLAWQLADRMAADDFEELCRVTVAQIHRDGREPGPDREARNA